MVKNPPVSAGDMRDVRSIPGSGRFPWRRTRKPTPVLLPGESHGRRSLVGYGPYGHKKLDTTEVTQHACTLINTYGRLQFDDFFFFFPFESIFTFLR